MLSDGEGGALLPLPEQDRVRASHAACFKPFLWICQQPAGGGGPCRPHCCPSHHAVVFPCLLQLAVGMRTMPHETAAEALQMAAIHLAQRVA